MTPKEKAQELFHKFWDCDDIKSFELANQCALIAVDNMINECEKYFEAISKDRVEYWKEVKQEIENL